MTGFTDDVRVVPAGEAHEITYMEPKRRTPAQVHTDQALDHARDAQEAGLEAVTDMLAWMRSIGAQVPSEVASLPTTLKLAGEFLDDETRRRG